MSSIRRLAVCLALGSAAVVHAADVTPTTVDSTSISSREATRTPQQGAAAVWTAATSLSDEKRVAELWSLTGAELQRARMLMQGPRGSFSAANLSPVEVLGIHAQTDAERSRYARLFAQLHLDDNRRVHAWVQAASAESRSMLAPMLAQLKREQPAAAPRPQTVKPPHVIDRVNTNREPGAKR